ncbi:MAG: hypothetical protein KDB71_04295 [Mycobacterium sp.]|nr:hypothetical protein [Mycobacterium sp.]
MTHTNEIPPIETATDPINSAADLRERWRALMGNLGFGERLLWLGFIGSDRRMYKTLSQVSIGRSPDRRLVENLIAALVSALDAFQPGTSVALLLSRPGMDGLSADDRQWSKALNGAAQRQRLAIEPIFRANDVAVVPM